MLAEILAGFVADPLGVQFYHQSLNAKGEPAFDEHGIPLLDCNRGTNDVENTHKQIVTTFGTWVTGAEMASASSPSGATATTTRCRSTSAGISQCSATSIRGSLT